MSKFREQSNVDEPDMDGVNCIGWEEAKKELLNEIDLFLGAITSEDVLIDVNGELRWQIEGPFWVTCKGESFSAGG